MASIFSKDFFNNLFGQKKEDDEKLDEAVDLGKEKGPITFNAPKKMPDSLYNIDELIKKMKSGKKDNYDSPVLDKYYNKLGKQERKLDKGKMIEFNNPLSERFYLDGDIGQRATKENGLPNAESSGYTGLYTKRQMQEVGKDVSDKDVDVADVPSTAIAKMRYNPKTKNLYVTFTSSDKEYLYPNVPADVVRKFMNAPSKGRFANKRLPKYAVTSGEAQLLASKYKGK